MSRWYVIVLGAVAAFFASSYALAPSSILPAPLNAAWVLGLTLAVLACHRALAKRWCRQEHRVPLPELDPLERPLEVLAAAGALLFVQVSVSGLVSVAAPDRWAEASAKATQDLSFPLAVYFLAFAPVLEEICFRGWIQTVLSSRFSRVIGVVGAALLFTLAHWLVYSWQAIPSLLFMGTFFGAVVVGTGSLRAAIWLHASANATALLFMAVNRNGALPSLGASGNVVWWGLATAVSGLAFFATARVLWRHRTIASQQRHTGR